MNFRRKSLRVNAVRLSCDVAVPIGNGTVLAAQRGDWLIKDEQGDLSTREHRQFCREYEPADNFAAAYLARNRYDVSPV